MTPAEAISYITNCGWSKTRLGLGRTRELLRRLGNPDKRLRFVHVAGSNGKGSTCAMLESVLRAAGYRTGLYTSPHLVRFNERIRVNGEDIPDEALADITGRAALNADKMEEHPSQFELSTAIAMEYFAESECDIVVLEVGMGGEFDSTNVIDPPLAAVITNLGLDHTEYLGDTIEKIAATKAGIIKTGSCVVCYDHVPEARSVINDICTLRSVPLKYADFKELILLESSLFGQRILYKGKEYFISLAGDYQMRNAATAIEAAAVLTRRGLTIPERALKDGLAHVNWPARFEIMSRDPIVILDGGHNPQCAAALRESLHSLLNAKKVIMLTGMLKDKDYRRVTDILAPCTESFICVTPESPRALGSAELKDAILENGGEAVSCGSIEEGLRLLLDTAVKTQKPAVIFGSLYMAGEIKDKFVPLYRSWIRDLKKQERLRLGEKKRTLLSAAICRRTASLEVYKRAESIMIYKWTGGEVQLDLLWEMAVNDGKRVCCPIVHVRYMEAADISGNDVKWRKGAYGISEPLYSNEDITAPGKLDLVICPLTAFDERLNRLGMGQGYYDRFLPDCVNAYILGAAFEIQKFSEIPALEHDVRPDAVITEKGIYEL